jgi:hypothetical protein
VRGRVWKHNIAAHCLAPLVLLLIVLMSLPAGALPPGNEIWTGRVTKRADTTQVSAWWQVPSLSCSVGEFSDASQWIGLGGVNEPLVQIGISSRCPLSGIPTHHAVYQIVPMHSAAQNIPLAFQPVSTGDSIEAEIKYLGGDQYSLRIRDNSWSWEFSANMTQPDLKVAPKTAEWIVEAGGNVSLANYGMVHFENLFFNDQPLTTEASDAYIAEDAAGPKGEVSDISQFGGRGPNFDVKWLRS